jgi:DNA-binding beta-propeller fold protein YncE
LKKSALLFAVILAACLGTVSCNGGPHPALPPSKLTERIFASQSASGTTIPGALVIIDGEYDTLGRGEVSAGTSPGLMAISPERSIVMVFDMATNKVDVVSTKSEAVTGVVQLPGSTTSMVAPLPSAGYVAVPSAPFSGGFHPERSWP